MLQTFDFPILYWIQTVLTSPVMDNIMIFFTTIGDNGYVWIALTLLLFFNKKTRPMSIAMGFALLFGLVCGNLLLKNVVARPRPFQLEEFVLLIPAPSGYSFPSGHTLASFGAAFAFFFHKKKLGVIALMVAVLISFSRLYLFVHFPTDVLTSVVLGTLFGYLSYRISLLFTPWFNTRIWSKFFPTKE